jgi:hypothetical protein
VRARAARHRWATVALLAFAASCETSRTRPGPPTVTIDPPLGSTVYSPDTLRFSVSAQDPDGLDSLFVTVFDTTKAFETDFNTEETVQVGILVPAGLLPGGVIKIFARARDLTGEETLDTASITIIKRPP